MILLSFVLFFLTTLLFVSEAFANKLQIIEAGRKGKYGQVLPASSFCPERFSSKGFSIVCIPAAKDARWVIFKVNNKFYRREGSAPYVISGDIGDSIKPWKGYYNGMVISCADDKGGYVSQRFFSDCKQHDKMAHSRMQPPPPPPAPPVWKPSYPSKATSRSLPPPPPPPVKARPPPPPPPVKTNPPLAPPAPKPAKTGPLGVNKEFCVTRKAAQFVGGKPKDWKYVKNGALVYKEGDMTHDVDSPRRALLKYNLWVPKESNYGIVVDMTTIHPTEYNDVWLSCDQYLSLRKHAHSISTRYKLKPNTKYECTIGGRSTNVIVHGIILFPCEEYIYI